MVAGSPDGVRASAVAIPVGVKEASNENAMGARGDESIVVSSASKYLGGFGVAAAAVEASEPHAPRVRDTTSAADPAVHHAVACADAAPTRVAANEMSFVTHVVPKPCAATLFAGTRALHTRVCSRAVTHVLLLCVRRSGGRVDASMRCQGDRDAPGTVGDAALCRVRGNQGRA